MKPRLAIVLAAALLLTGGVVHGLYADRWGRSDALALGIERLPEVPASIDGWEAETVESSPAEFAQAGAQGYWSRVYRKDGKEILVILMVGRAGRMAVHRPDVCYRGAGYELASRPLAHDVGPARFWTANFAKPNAAGSEIELYWAWNGGDGWKSPVSPRWEFAGRPALYKLYLSQNRAGQTSEAQMRTIDAFLTKFTTAFDGAIRS